MSALLLLMMVLACVTVVRPSIAATGTCAINEATGTCKPINKTCQSLEDHQIDWDCIFGPESLEEVHQRGGEFTTCPSGSKMQPCSRFIVAKNEERSEVKVQEGPEGFPFLYGETYIFKYSFRAVEGMQVATRFTHLGQLKGSAGGYMISGDPIYSLTANKYGLNIRFSNLESIEDFHAGMENFLDWEEATGQWVHVEIITTFGKSMKVNISGAVNGQAEWPSHLTPVAWHRDSEMVRMKLGLYHKIHEVADGEVEYRDISIEGPNGIIRTSPMTEEEVLAGETTAVDRTCDVLEGKTIDWECILGPGALSEVEARGGNMLSCPIATKYEPCSRFIVPKEQERAEVVVQNGPEGFNFKKGERYVFKYSFRVPLGMRVATYSTRFGQLKGTSLGYLLEGDPLMQIAATNQGINVRFSNLEGEWFNGMDKFLSWEETMGDWVHVEIKTTFGKSMQVSLSGAVEGMAIWPESLAPVAWQNDADMMCLRLGLYHKKNEVGYGDVEYKNVMIEGPKGVIRTSNIGINDYGDPEGILFKACVRDAEDDRVLDNIYRNNDMTVEMCAKYCAGEEYFGVQYGNECWCGGENDEDAERHGPSTCDYPCAGHDEQVCGGWYAISLYQYGGSPGLDIPEGSKYLGCYADHRFERAMSFSLASSSDMTHEWCYSHCKTVNAKYFGVQWGRECFCGDQDEDYAIYGTSLCDMPCSGDPSLVCGSSLAMNVFMIY